MESECQFEFLLKLKIETHVTEAQTVIFGILISENQTATQWQTEIICRPEQIQQQITVGHAVMRSIGFVQFKVFFLKDTFDLLAWERQFLLISPIGEKRD